VTEEQMLEFERDLGFPLPSDYREFLLKYNGGYPVVAQVRGRDDEPGIPYRHGDGVRTFFKLPVSGGAVESYEQLRLPTVLPGNIPENWLVIGDDAGGNCFVLKLGSQGGEVRFLDHESSSEDEPARLMADSFLDLLLRFITVEEHGARNEAKKQAERRALEHGAFPRELEAQIQKVEARHPKVREWCRLLSLKVFGEKGYYAVHGDETSRRLLDLMFWLYQDSRPNPTPILRTELATMITGWWKASDDGFGLNGYAPDYLREWWQDRLASGALAGNEMHGRLTEKASAELLDKMIRQL
jgi:hypothetical protein